MQRRTFVKGIAATSLLALGTTTLEAKTRHMPVSNSNTLKGKEFFLTIDYTRVNLTGNTAVATTINGQISGPTLVWK